MIFLIHSYHDSRFIYSSSISARTSNLILCFLFQFFVLWIFFSVRIFSEFFCELAKFIFSTWKILKFLKWLILKAVICFFKKIQNFIVWFLTNIFQLSFNQIQYFYVHWKLSYWSRFWCVYHIVIMFILLK